MQLYVVRHGQTEWNVAGRWQGHKDSPLTAKGRDDARASAALLRALVVTHDGVLKELDALLGLRTPLNPDLGEATHGQVFRFELPRAT